MKRLLVVIAAAYTGLFLSLSSDPFTDAPNHLARAGIMKSLWFDPHSPYLGTFSASHFFMPYMLPDVGLVLMMRVSGSLLVGPVWCTITMLVLMLGVWFYARQVLTTSWAVAAAVLCSWYFATNYLFILGFFSFQWGVAASFAALGALEAWRRERRFGWFALYAVACLFSYGAHLAAFAILAAITGAVGFVRVVRKIESWPRFTGEMLPFAMLIAYHVLLLPTHPEAYGGALNHSTLGDKFGHFIEAMFVRENYVIDRSILIVFWGIVAFTMWAGRRRGLGRHWELAVTCGLAAVIYFVLPFGLGGIFYIDERALPFFFIPLLMLALRMFEDSTPGRRDVRLLMVTCSLLAVGNFGSLAWFLPRQNRLVAQYREAVRTIPARKIVLPIQTRERDGNTYPLRHAAAFYVLDREGYIPYLFSQVNGGGPSGYFLDHSTIYRPPQDWYLRGAAADWEQVARTYDYVVITKPWYVGRIDTGRLELQYENAVASVFRVRR